MANECELCRLLDGGPLDCVSKSDSREIHSKMHERQLRLIVDDSNEVSHAASTVCKKRRSKNSLADNCVKASWRFCNRLLKNEKRDRINCKACGQSVVCRRLGQITASVVVDHACRHLGKVLYKCAHCDYKFICRAAMRNHFHERHQIPTNPKNYIDISSEHQADILDTIEECFGKGPPKKSVSKVQRQINFRESKSPLVTYCRKIANDHGNECDIVCLKCETRITVDRQSWLTAGVLLTHALWHLNRPLFACRQCHKKFVTKTAVISHLKKIHALGGHHANCVDMSAGHENDIKDMVTQCFDPNRPRVGKLEPTDHSRIPRGRKGPVSNLAHNLVTKFGEGDRIQCALCPKSIPIFPLRSTTVDQLIMHVHFHSDKPMFECRLCRYSTHRRPAMNSHIRNVHKLSGTQPKTNYVDRTSEFQSEIISMWQDCFGGGKSDSAFASAISEEEKRRRLTKMINGRAGDNVLLAERQVRCSELSQKFHRSGKLRCQLCQKDISTTHHLSAMNHGLSHVNKSLFTCRHCTYTSTTRPMIYLHIKRMHTFATVKDFDDRTNDFHMEIMGMLSKCYDLDSKPDDSCMESLDSQISRRRLITKSRGNNLKATRMLHINELIRKHSKGGRMICGICSRSTPAAEHSGPSLHHALSHLEKPYRPFQCKRCDRTSHLKQAILSHVKSDHKGHGTSIKFEDLSDKFHLKIMDILSKCYDLTK